MGFLSWIIFGLIAGALAKLVLPGKQGGGFIVTCILGIVGAIVGGFLGSLLFHKSVSGFNLYSFFISVVGALIALAVYGWVTGRKAI